MPFRDYIISAQQFRQIMKTKPTPPIKEFSLISFEEEVKLDQEFPERERGGIATLVRAILYKNEHENVLITIHKSFMANSYYQNPAALTQQLNIHTHHYIKAWRDGDCIKIRASHEDFVNPRSWIGSMCERVLKTCPDIMPDGRDGYIDLEYSEVPITYQNFPTLAQTRMNEWLLQHCNHNHRIEVRAFQKRMRLWLRKEQSKSPSHSRKH